MRGQTQHHLLRYLLPPSLGKIISYFSFLLHSLLDVLPQKGEPVSVLDVLNCDSDCEDGSSSVPNPTSYSSAAMTPSPQQYTPTSSPSVPAISHKQDKPASSSPAYTPSPEPSKSVEPSPTPTPASPKSSPTSSPSGGDGSDWHYSGVYVFPRASLSSLTAVLAPPTSIKMATLVLVALYMGIMTLLLP
jgi:hypothetical protein